MKKSFYLAASLLILASGFQFGSAQDKAATRTLKVNVKYTGSSTTNTKSRYSCSIRRTLPGATPCPPVCR
jgi:hypothetical protein